MAAKKYIDAIQMFLQKGNSSKNFSSIVNTCRVLKADEGKVSVEFEVNNRMTNHFGTLHGGCSATMVDEITTGALVATPRGMPGVSVDLHMIYLALANVGDTIQLDAEIIREGKSMAFTKASLYRKADMTLLATGLHTVVLPSQVKFRKEDAKEIGEAKSVQQVISPVVPSSAVNPDHYRTMLRFEKMDRDESTFSGRAWNAHLTSVDERKLSAEFVVGEHQRGCFSRCTLVFPVQPFGTLHGGCTATMIDYFTCASLVVATGRPAVSINLNMTYMNPAPLGTLVRIDAEVVKIGKSLAYTKAELTRVDNGALVASAKHTMAFNKRVVIREE